MNFRDFFAAVGLAVALSACNVESAGKSTISQGNSSGSSDPVLIIKWCYATMATQELRFQLFQTVRFLGSYFLDYEVRNLRESAWEPSDRIEGIRQVDSGIGDVDLYVDQAGETVIYIDHQRREDGFRIKVPEFNGGEEVTVGWCASRED
jgi:hypothetical protein